MPSPPGLYTHPQFLSDDTLHEIEAFVAAASGELAAVQAVPGAPLVVNEQVRRVWEVELPDHLLDAVLARIEAVHEALETHFAIPLQPCAAVAALRYPPGSFYRTHRDVSAEPGPHDLHRRTVSLVLFLNSAGPGAVSGGTLRLLDLEGAHGSPQEVIPVAGTLVAFRSSVLHEVTPVMAGTRASIVAWLLAADEVAALPEATVL